MLLLRTQLKRCDYVTAFQDLFDFISVKGPLAMLRVCVAHGSFRAFLDKREDLKCFQSKSDCAMVALLLQLKDLAPPVETKGHWVLVSTHPQTSTGFKSFGWFQCAECFQCWLSAHAHSKFTQSCKSCNVWILPKFMWINEEWSERRAKKDDDDPPHRCRRCEVCKLGSFQLYPEAVRKGALRIYYWT